MILQREAAAWLRSGEWIIYGLKEMLTSSIRYVGATSQPRVRLRNHCNEKGGCHRTNWIRSVLARSGKIEMVLLYRVPRWAKWQDAERAWIRYGYDAGWELTNGTSGGDGISQCSQEVRDKISRALKGRVLSQAQRQAISDRQRGKPGYAHTDASKAKLRAAHTGKCYSRETRLAIAVAKQKLSAADVAKVLEMLAAGTPQSQVAKTFGVSQPTISAIKNGHRLYMEANHAQ